MYDTLEYIPLEDLEWYFSTRKGYAFLAINGASIHKDNYQKIEERLNASLQKYLETEEPKDVVNQKEVVTPKEYKENLFVQF